MNASPRRRLRWYQYSLRSLFVLTLLAAIGGSWFGVKKRQVERRRAAVAAIEEQGGWVRYDYQLDASGNVTANAQPPGPMLLRRMLGDDFFSHVVEAALRGPSFTDASLEHIQCLRELESLWLDGSQITDDGMVNLRGLQRLKFLELGRTRISDAGLANIRDLKQLQLLWLDNTQVTDAGMMHIQGLTQLRELLLFRTHLTDAGLDHLRGLTQLEFLAVGDTQVTPSGVRRLQQSLPNCRSDR